MTKKLGGVINLSNPRIRTIGIDPFHKPLRGAPLSQTHPMLIIEWRHKGPDNPDTVTAGSGKRVRWQCSHCGNEFTAAINLRTRAIDEGRESQGCPYCSKGRSETKLPEPLPDYLISECIDEFGKTPRDKLLDDSREFRLWRCSKCKHQYRSSIKARLGSKSVMAQGCPVCFDGRKVDLRQIRLSDYISSKSKDPLIKNFKKGKKNQGFNPNSMPSSHKVFWSCDYNNKHMPYMSCDEMLIGGCKSCIKEKSRVFLSEHEELSKQFVEAVRYPYWTPKNILEGSSMVVLWQCPKSADHRWRMSVERRAIDGQGCPFCSNKRISQANNFAAQHPELAMQWDHDANEVTPDLVKAKSREKYFFQCNKGHSFHVSPWERIERKVGCQICKEVKNSVAKNYPWAIDEWMERLNYGSTPWNTAPNSKKEIWWQCKRAKNHIYKKSVYDRLVRGLGCKRCRLEKPLNESILMKHITRI